MGQIIEDWYVPIKCPKCGAESGDDWSQCNGKCPMAMSPYYDPDIGTETDNENE